MSQNKLLSNTAARAARYVSEIAARRVAPTPEAIAGLEALAAPLNDDPIDPETVIDLLDRAGSPATIASTGPRYFGFVTGGSLPAAMAANWLTTAWDQNTALFAQSPAGARVEEIVSAWLLNIFGFPSTCAVGFVTGATVANFTALAAARHALLERAGWNVEDRGMFGAPEITVVVGDEVHVSLTKALAMLGFGRARVTRVPADSQGRMLADRLPPLNDRTLVCIQAGNVNTGAFDPAGEICARAHASGAWVHVDGAFGLWAASAPERAPLMHGYSGADSWATDCHKWLNVPYDSGLALVRDPRHLQAAMGFGNAAYLTMSENREPALFAPEASRRSRGIDVWAALRSLGRTGLAGMIETNCRQAQRFAEGLRHAGFEILNDVVLNQVLVSFGDAEKTRRVIRDVQDDGTCWCGGTEWHGRAAMRISVSSWATTGADVDASLAAICRIAGAVKWRLLLFAAILAAAQVQSSHEFFGNDRFHRAYLEADQISFDPFEEFPWEQLARTALPWLNLDRPTPTQIARLTSSDSAGPLFRTIDFHAPLPPAKRNYLLVTTGAIVPVKPFQLKGSVNFNFDQRITTVTNRSVTGTTAAFVLEGTPAPQPENEAPASAFSFRLGTSRWLLVKWNREICMSSYTLFSIDTSLTPVASNDYNCDH